MTDPIADLIVQIKNAFMAKKDFVHVQFSKLKYEILKIFQEKGIVESFSKEESNKKSFLKIKLKYPQKYFEFKRISKPGRRIYVGYREIKPVKQGYGFGIISTPRGLMTEIEAKKKKIGGEYLIEVY